MGPKAVRHCLWCLSERWFALLIAAVDVRQGLSTARFSRASLSASGVIMRTPGRPPTSPLLLELGMSYRRSLPAHLSESLYLPQLFWFDRPKTRRLRRV